MSTDLELVRRGHRVPATVVTTRSGRRLSASVARRTTESIPASSRTARAWRWQTYAAWCTQAGFAADEPGAVPSFLAHLADRGHPVGTLRAFVGTLRAMLALDQAQLDAEDLKLCERVIVHRAREIADDPTAEPGPLQADSVTPEDLRAMVRALPATARGIRDRALLLLDWWMAGRCSEPAALNLHDVVISTADLVDEATGELVPVPALEVHIRRSKADQQARGQVVRILAPDDDQELCPITALRAWLDVLTDDEQLTAGPLFRRIDRHGRIGAAAAGRRCDDDARQGGITARTVRNIIQDAARAAALVPTPTSQELAEARAAKTAAYTAAAAARSAEEGDRILARWRTAVRSTRRAIRRITGHSMRRGFIQTALESGHPADRVAQHSRHAPGSQAFWSYTKRLTDWRDNLTRTIDTRPTATDRRRR
ncbi:hypothetical protein DQ384_36765 [Sphaerisporangium album]|uniref:Tyr recombinase domain-containing protein n=1 Tax=Sphaerisporangium album TaxID=509200 RepID=A0A367EU84_9ACTN|nr:hypothetical protein [Sphaerisporangium album]RCG21165.1 hypothetical protein DQ384_36765 [Sphaerisporangium album]